jgi:hypothetical protein
VKPPIEGHRNSGLRGREMRGHVKDTLLQPRQGRRTAKKGEKRKKKKEKGKKEKKKKTEKRERGEG